MDLSTLSPEQKFAFQRFIQNENIFLTGQGGTGKTRLIEYFARHCKDTGKSVQVCALTGCATILLPKICNARTIHSWSGIRLCRGSNQSIVSNALRTKAAKAAWRKTHVLIVDEVSMMSVKMFEVLDEIARSARANNSPFGGIQMVFVGDFYQLPPVGTAGDPETDRFCFESPLWNRVFPARNHIELLTVFRQVDPLYREILSQIRTATLSEESIRTLNGYVKREYDSTKYNGCVPPKLYPVRAKADYLNNLMYSKLEGEERSFECVKKTSCKTFLEANTPLSIAHLERGRSLTPSETEFELAQLMNTSAFQECFALKVGAVVMCTVNLDMDQGICNGSQGIVISIIETSKGYFPIVKFTNGVERTIYMHYIQSDEYPTIAVGQIPLCLSWAMTIHKIQGATLPMASIDVGGQIFEYGQTYVALSRVESLDGLYLTAFHAEKVRANDRVIEFYSKMLKQDYAVDENTGGSRQAELLPSTNVFKQFAHSEFGVSRSDIGDMRRISKELGEEDYVDSTIKRIVL